MLKVLKLLRYSFFDMLRSKWIVIYTVFFLFTGFMLLYFNADLSRAVVSLMNIVLVFIPLISCMLGTIHYYNSREFIELLLAQPVKREQVFLGNYLGVAFSLSLAYILGLGIPFLAYGVTRSPDTGSFVMMMAVGVLLTFIFSALAYWISMVITDRMKGFGSVIVLWLYMAVLYDGIFLLLLTAFQEYPLEKPAIVLTTLNPIDLSRVLIMLKLDVAALLGYTGAVFKKFFGTSTGMLIASGTMLIWIVVPVTGLALSSQKKDF
ncbi:MAG TPA: ABC transporter permease subunit [Chitinophagales bacterium]|nr:ABC transporter permease subunit [Chitinophagales bacterium]